jgi:hypothetical protein
LVRPFTLYDGDVTPVATDTHVAPFRRSIVYERMGEPPFDTGASHVRATEESDPTATKARGTEGTPAGKPATGVLDTLAPTPFDALTRNRYIVPFASPVIVDDVVEADTEAAGTQLMPSVERSTA